MADNFKTVDVLFETTELLFVNKPAGIPVHATVDKSRDDFFSLVKNKISSSLFLVHRLDKDTSGVLLLSKTQAAAQWAISLFEEKKIQKRYLAITVAESNFKKSSWKVDNHLALKSSDGKKQMQPVRSGGQRAITDFQILKRSSSAFLVEASPQTGRTHQIRSHLMTSGLPILGDALYDGKSSLVPRTMLHASSLTFLRNPPGVPAFSVVAPLPKDFQSVLKRVGV